MPRRPNIIRLIFLGAIYGLVGARMRAQDTVETGVQLRELAEQNRQLQEQVKQQQRVIESLAAKLGEVQKTGERHERQLQELKEGGAVAESSRPTFKRDQEVRLTGEVGLALFKTGTAGPYDKATFRADDAKLFVEAPVMRDVYFNGEVDLATREQSSVGLGLGELYVDFENVSSRLGGSERLLNVRVGQFYTPFGEEYAVRGPIANPLISHSLSDVWGIDAGVEAYGAIGAWAYAAAVQNGGGNVLHDYNADKALMVRLAWSPVSWLRVSGSALRTGELKVETATVPGDGLSSLWFANGFFRELGSTKTTGKFWASLYESDATARWKGGHATAALGRLQFDDSDLTANNARRMRYGYLEAAQDLAGGLYGAARYSEIRAPNGYPLAGWANPGEYFFAPSLTEVLKRLSLGVGYRFGPPLVLKLEYSWEWGRQTNGAKRDQEYFFGTEVGLRF